jgi:SAM-dependent methyltransferase
MTLVELSAQLLERARAAFSEAGIGAERLLCGDACDLSELPSADFEAGLLLGPLYHLVDPPQRLAALAELYRVLKPGGIGIVAYLNSWGILRCGVADFPERYADGNFTHSLLGELTFRDSLPGFTACYWTTPQQALHEIEVTGFELVSYCGAEGFAGGMRPIIERIADEQPAAFANLVRMAAETSELPQYRDATEHLHLVVRKPVEPDLPESSCAAAAAQHVAYRRMICLC